jgi:hypothetical protein
MVSGPGAGQSLDMALQKHSHLNLSFLTESFERVYVDDLTRNLGRQHRRGIPLDLPDTRAVASEHASHAQDDGQE